MMSRTFEEHRLPTGFTFRIIEIIKHIKIKVHPMSRITGLSWGISSAAWALLAILGISLNLGISNPVDEYIRTAVNSSLPGDMVGLRTGELLIPADIMKSPELTVKSDKSEAINDKAAGEENQKAFALAPFAEGGKWERKADMPTARFFHSACLVNGKIYVTGGYDGQKCVSTIEEYDPVKDKWTKKADMPTARFGLSTSIVNGKIYAIGGGNDLANCSMVEEYNPEEDIWMKKTDMPTARCHLSTYVMNGKIYAIGGLDNNAVAIPTVEEYEPVRDTWIRKNDMSTARAGFGTIIVNGKIYVIGGDSGEWDPNGMLPLVEEYDPIRDAWTKKSDMPIATACFGISAANEKIYVIGGWVPQQLPGVSTMFEYDPTIDKWAKKSDMLTARMDLPAVAANGKIYAIGGTTSWPMCLSITEEYTPEGWPFNAIFPQDNLPSTWGEKKRER